MLNSHPLITLLLATLLSACQAGSNASENDPLAEARQRWADQGLEDYRYQARQQCYCGPGALQPASILVSDQQARLEDPANQELRPLARTVEAWFALIEEKQRKGWHQVEVDYHPEQGYPRHIRLDFDPRMADDEQQYWIKDLAPTAATPSPRTPYWPSRHSPLIMPPLSVAGPGDLCGKFCNSSLRQNTQLCVEKT